SIPGIALLLLLPVRAFPEDPSADAGLTELPAGSIPQPLSRTTTRYRRDREFDRELWILSKKLTGIYFPTEDFALFCCAL
ncbi:MAG: hypothetical protein WA735_05980, partial [Candidatus Acidiferrales bacterium]